MPHVITHIPFFAIVCYVCKGNINTNVDVATNKFTNFQMHVKVQQVNASTIKGLQQLCCKAINKQTKVHLVLLRDNESLSSVSVDVDILKIASLTTSIRV